MPEIGILLLANVFTALLPPIDPDESEFYDILGLEKNANNEQIRKAYKKASLKYHPDKVAQRREDPAEAAAHYEKVQEAYGVLVNEEKRQRYKALGYSPTRYRFVAQGTLSNPGALYENLTSATFADKTRLVILTSIIVLIILMQPILIAAKINHVVEQRGALEDSSWVLLLLPFWVVGACNCLFWVVLVALVPPSAKFTILVTTLEHIMWYWGVMRLARKWDGNLEATYASVLIPVYLAMALQWMQGFMILQKIRHDVRRMVTLDFLEKEVLKGKSLEDLTEEEREEMRNDYMVVTVPPDFEPHQEDENTPLDDKAIEEQKVEASPEFEAATEIYNSTFGNLMGSLIFGITFLITLTLKLDGKIKGSWWAVFTPIWIYWGSKWLYYFYGCACASVSGEEIIMHLQEPEGKEESKEEEKSETKDGDKEETEGDSKKNDEESDRRPSDSNFFAAETSIEFVKKSDNDSDDNRPDDEKEADRTEATVKVKKSTKKPPTDTPKETTGEEKTNEKQPDDKEKVQEKKDDGDDNDNDENDDDESETIHIDEETFKAWQNAYEEAERGAMEEQAKNSMECCILSIKLMLILLVVAKIEKNYENDDPDDVGFNTFWILSPFFLFFGVICCCCTCLIYGASPGDADDLYGQPQQDGENDEENPATESGKDGDKPEPLSVEIGESSTNAETPIIIPSKYKNDESIPAHNSDDSGERLSDGSVGHTINQAGDIIPVSPRKDDEDLVTQNMDDLD